MTGPALYPGRALEFLSRATCTTVVKRFTWSMADTGLCRVVPCDLYPLVLGFLRDNQLSEVASKFVKATGATQQDANASSLLDIYSFWLKSTKAPKVKLQSNGPVTKKAKKETSSSDSSEDSSEEEVKAKGLPTQKAAAPTKRASVPQHAGKAAAKASESSSSEESSDEEEEDKKKSLSSRKQLSPKPRQSDLLRRRQRALSPSLTQAQRMKHHRHRSQRQLWQLKLRLKPQPNHAHQQKHSLK